MLADAALDGCAVGRFLMPRATARTIAGLARHPRRTARDVSGLGLEWTRVAAGHSAVAPAQGDRGLGDRAWKGNWLLHRIVRGYLAAGDTLDRLISDADLNWRTERQARFAASNVLDALAPTNFPWSNPAVLKQSIDEGGANLVRSGRRSCTTSPRHRNLPPALT